MRSTTSIVRRRGMTPRAKSFGFITFITSTISTLRMRLRAGNGRQRSSDAGLLKTLLAQGPAGGPGRPRGAGPAGGGGRGGARRARGRRGRAGRAGRGGGRGARRGGG